MLIILEAPKTRKLRFSAHCLNRMEERDIRVYKIEQVIKYGGREIGLDRHDKVENYVFKDFGLAVVLPFAVFRENVRGTKYLDIDTEELKDKVAFSIITYPYAYNGAILQFIRNYLDLSTIQMAKLLDVA